MASDRRRMFPSSLAVILAGLVVGGLALTAFAWAWRRGQFDHLEDQARVILDARDYRLARPWESPTQQAERRVRYGPLEPPTPGEWGGAA